MQYCECLCLLILETSAFLAASLFYWLTLSYTGMYSVQVSHWSRSTPELFHSWQEMWQTSNRRLVPFRWPGWICYGLELCPHSQMQYKLTGMDGRKPSDSWRRRRFEKSLFSWIYQMLLYGRSDKCAKLWPFLHIQAKEAACLQLAILWK